MVGAPSELKASNGVPSPVDTIDRTDTDGSLTIEIGEVNVLDPVSVSVLVPSFTRRFVIVLGTHARVNKVAIRRIDPDIRRGVIVISAEIARHRAEQGIANIGRGESRSTGNAEPERRPCTKRVSACCGLGRRVKETQGAGLARRSCRHRKYSRPRVRVSRSQLWSARSPAPLIAPPTWSVLALTVTVGRVSSQRDRRPLPRFNPWVPAKAKLPAQVCALSLFNVIDWPLCY